MTLRESSKLALHWLFVAMGIVGVAVMALFLRGSLTLELFFTALLVSEGVVAALFFLLRILMRSNDMPGGWADPVINKKARWDIGSPEDQDDRYPCESPLEGDGPVEYLSDTGKVDDAELAGEFLQMGRLLLKSGRYTEAKSAFKKAHDQDPGNSKVYNYLGISYGRLNHFEEAVDAYNKAIALDYDYASAHFNLASVYDQMGDAQNAVNQWQRYLDVGKVVGERKDMLERARSRLDCLKNGTDRKRSRPIAPPEPEDNPSD